MASNSKERQTIRSASYSVEEDKLLCNVYLDISQNSIIGKDQSVEQFWGRIEKEYHQSLPVHITNVRPRRSLQSRMQTIIAAVGKLRGCVRQIEYMNPSGASEQDIVDQAKVLLSQDVGYKKGFKFDHVWPILKNIEKFCHTVTTPTSARKKRSSSGNEISESDSTTQNSIGDSSFNFDLNADFEKEDMPEENVASKRPVGRQKEKMKRKQKDDMNQFMSSMKEDSEHMKKIMEENTSAIQESRLLLKQNYELQLIRAQNEAKKLQLKEQRREDKILEKDLDSITDLQLREIYRAEKMKIIAKRAQEIQFDGVGGSSNVYGQYFAGLGGNGDDLPDY